MPESPPFILTQRPDGQHELRAFSDNSEEPIVLRLVNDSGRRFGLAVADVLTSLDAGTLPHPIRLHIDGRAVTVEGTSEHGLRVIVGP